MGSGRKFETTRTPPPWQNGRPFTVRAANLQPPQPILPKHTTQAAEPCCPPSTPHGVKSEIRRRAESAPAATQKEQAHGRRQAKGTAFSLHEPGTPAPQPGQHSPTTPSSRPMPHMRPDQALARRQSPSPAKNRIQAPCRRHASKRTEGPTRQAPAATPVSRTQASTHRRQTPRRRLQPPA